MNTAEQIKILEIHSGKHQAVYKLSKPLSGFKYVVVSSVCDTYAYETYIFGSTEDGEILSWSELEGSEKCTMSHEQVLSNAGYTVI